MKRFAAKLAFVHRTLWQNDRAYRWAVLLGPPPVLGVGLAAAVLVLLRLVVMPVHDPTTPEAGREAIPWAQWTRPITETAQPAEEPVIALPPTDASGRFPGFRAGWIGSLHPLTVDATMDADVSATPLTTFSLEGPVISWTRLMQGGPSTGLYIVGVRGLFVVRTSGEYGFAIRLARTGGPPADCLVRLGAGRRNLVRRIELNMAGETTLPNPPASLRLRQGLLPMAVAAGCWKGDRPVGPGEITLLVRSPDAAVFRPFAAADMIKPDQAN